MLASVTTVVRRTGMSAALELAWPAVSLARSAGVDLQALLSPAQLTLRDFGVAERRIDQAVLCDLWDRAEKLTGGELFGLRALPFARRRLVTDYILLHAVTLEDAIRRGLRFERIWQDGREGALDIEGDCAVLRWRARNGVRFSRCMSEFVLSLFAASAGFAAGGPLAGMLREVRFPLSPSGAMAELTRFFAAPLRFDAGEQALVFPARLLSTPNIHADPVLLGIVERDAQRVIERLPPIHSFIDGVRAWIDRELSSGHCSVETVAARLALSPRTLRRRLEGEGTSFRQLIDTQRLALAREQLASGHVTIDELAMMLGYTDASAFGKAFKRWTGSAPSDFRRAELAGMDRHVDLK